MTIALRPIAWLSDLDIGLGLWDGVFEDVPGTWLRWCDRQGYWFLTDTEQSQAQLLQAAQNLLATGMPVGQVAQLLSVSEQQISTLKTT